MSLVQNVFGFEGRISRQKYMFFGVLTLVGGAFLIGPGGSAVARVAGHAAGMAVAILVALAWLWIGISLTARRLHDVGWSGVHAVWIIALLVADGVVPFAVKSSVQQRFLAASAVGLAALVVLCGILLRAGTAGPNRYGPPPGRFAASGSLAT